MAFALFSSASTTKITAMTIDNSLSAAQKEAGVLSPEVMWKIARVGGSAISPDGGTVVYTVTKYDMAENKGTTNIYKSATDGSGAICLDENSSNEGALSWSADGSKIYFLSDRSGDDQLWSCEVDGANPTQITDVEGGIEAYEISADGSTMYYTKKVKVEKRSGSELYPEHDKAQVLVYDDLMARHWSYWDKGEYSHIFVAAMGGDMITLGEDIMAGEPWDAPMAPYFNNAEIAISHDGTKIAYSCKKMTGTEYTLSTDSDIYLYDIETKQTVNLTEGMVGYDRYPRFSLDDKVIAFSSMERPSNESDKERLFTVDLKSGDKKYLTPDFDYNAYSIAWKDDATLVFLSSIEATHQLCEVAADGSSSVRVITEGDHDLTAFSSGGGKVVVERMTISSPVELFSVDMNNGAIAQITNTNPEIYENIAMGEVQKRWITTTDGKQMLTWVILPPDFDPAKKYPTLLYCQGGPQSVVSQFWSYRWNFQAMAAQGYIVVAPNRRGLPSFGQEWLDQISGDYSGQNIQDYLSAIDALAEEDYVDSERLGCVGASYGGYSVYYLAGNHDKRFKAFIAHCGMFNFESMYGETEEMWFMNNDLKGSYWSDDPIAKRSYANSPHKFVQNWDTPILIVTGANDFRIPYTESLQAFNAARLRGIPSRLLLFEDEGHQVFKPQNSVIWHKEFYNWLDKYLK